MSGKPYLSNLGDAELNSIRHPAVNNLFPEEVKRRRKLEKAQEQLEDGWTRFMNEADKLQTREATTMKEWQERSERLMTPSIDAVAARARSGTN